MTGHWRQHWIYIIMTKVLRDITHSMKYVGMTRPILHLQHHWRQVDIFLHIETRMDVDTVFHDCYLHGK